MRKKKNETHSSKLNLLECRPIRRVQYEIAPSGTVVLLRPRFTSGLSARWLQPRLKRPYVRITLDRIGSFVWTRCDGNRTVKVILEEMKASFGENGAKDTEDAKDPKNSKDTRDTEDAKDPKNSKDTRDTEDAKDTKNSKDTRDTKDSNDEKKGQNLCEDMEHALDRLRLFLLHLKQNDMLTLES